MAQMKQIMWLKILGLNQTALIVSYGSGEGIIWRLLYGL